MNYNISTNVLNSVPSGALQSRASGRHNDPNDGDNDPSYRKMDEGDDAR
jgi:hypothetical protein